MKLHFGVLDVPYSGPANAPRRVALRTKKGAKPRAISAPPSGGETTGDVAEILEEKYSVFGTFWRMRGQQIADALIQDMADGFADIAQGRNAPISFTASESAAQTLFNEFIDSKAMDGLIKGVPTLASLLGVNHRMRHPYARRPPRPSFKDTGLYEQSARMWVEK